jgi:cell division protein FtsB
VLGLVHSPVVRVLLIVGIVFLQYHLWLSDTGILRHHRLTQHIQRVESENHRVQDDSRKIEAALDDLRSTDGQLLVNNAREGLGMVGPDETLYQVVSN